MSGVMLTPEQARLLLPVIQQIAERDSPGRMPMETKHKTPNSSTSGGSSSSGRRFPQSPYFPTSDSTFSTSASEAEGGCRYDMNELFRKKKKNTKSTEAQSYFCVSFMLE